MVRLSCGYWLATVVIYNFTIFYMFVICNNAIQIYKCVATEDQLTNSVGYLHVLIIIIWDFGGAIQPFSKERIKCCEALYEVGVKKKLCMVNITPLKCNYRIIFDDHSLLTCRTGWVTDNY